jgi:hypothetical protein
MIQRLAPIALLLPVIACATTAGEDARSGSSAISTSDPVQCISFTNDEVVPTGSKPSSTEGCSLQAQAIDIAPGQTNVYLEVDAGVDWPNPGQVSISIQGLPAGVTATWTQTSGYIPPDQGIAGAFQFIASVNAQPSTTEITVVGQSGSTTQSVRLQLVVGGVCVPATCSDQCGAVANNCSGTLECGGCSTGAFCNASHICQEVNAPKCPSGTHSCGNGICAKICE